MRSNDQVHGCESMIIHVVLIAVQIGLVFAACDALLRHERADLGTFWLVAAMYTHSFM